ncbi:unnamed protein product [Ostreobium quekettii]|uniref:TRP C-terminal domain-containing protein n=1 Tax=Ostreobium quekettii TaxID=121088 RepID=A0A8S1ISC7_9CHLO|nr:unnamed protein product [Ostreobium quekettii]|eukprot:evm.model.scf_648.2 EVM.evm.TU.scf_648.2   scf_648:4145-18650(-)
MAPGGARAATRCLLAAIALLALAAPATRADGGRHLLQQNASTIVLTAENVTQIADEIAGLGDGSVVVLDLENATLEGPLQIGAALTIRGASAGSAPVINCAPRGRRGRFETALEVSANITLEDLVIRQCGNPAVSLTPDVGAVLSATFRRVLFEDTVYFGRSARIGSDILSGGAIGAVSGFDILVEECIFRNNTGSSGGAIAAFGSNVTIINSSFVGNKLDNSQEVGFGGAVSIRSSSTFPGGFLTVEGCNFTENIDPVGGSQDELQATSGGFPLEGTQFVNFVRPRFAGGALIVERLTDVRVSGSNFERNIANHAGGAIYVSDVETTEVSDCSFTDNEARTEDGLQTREAQGGALYIELTPQGFKFNIKDCNFTNNSAGYGGAIHYVGQTAAVLDVMDVIFEGNRATIGGGAMLLRNSQDTKFLRTQFRNNVGATGGAMMLANAAGMTLTGSCGRSDSEFTGNVAVTGGGVAARGGGVMMIDDNVLFENNHALESGGAIAVIDGTITTGMDYRNPIVVNNSATRGGGIFVDSIGSISVRPGGECDRSELSSNVATYGAGMLVRAESRIPIEILVLGTSFVGNAALQKLTSAWLVEDSRGDFFRGVTGAENFENLQRVISTRMTKLELLDGVSMEGVARNDAADVDALTLGGGAGMLLELDQGTGQSGVSARVENGKFERNFGTLGGGLMAIVNGTDWKPSCQPEETSCRSLRVTNVNFTQNGALSTAGGLFASDPRNVFVDDANQTLVDFLGPLEQEFPIDEPITFVDNSVGEGGFGQDSASFASRLVLSNRTMQRAVETENGIVTFINTGRLDHNSSDPLPDLVIEVQDSFNQTITSGTPDARLSVEVTATNATPGGTVGDVLSGARIAEAVNGVATFKDTFARALNGTYTMKFFAQQPRSLSTLESQEFQFIVRDCLIGETRLGVVCTQCRGGFFSLDPKNDVTCHPCPSNAVCNGGAAVVPNKGFWHSTPFSSQIHECLLVDACRFDDRQKDLQEFFNEFANSGNSTLRTNVTEEEYDQCAEGYENVLCGACSEGFGHVESECRMCEKKSRQRFLFLLIVIWQLIVLMVTIKGALSAGADMGDLRAFLQQSGMVAGDPGQIEGRIHDAAFPDDGKNRNILDGARTTSLPTSTIYSQQSNASYASDGDLGSARSQHSPGSAQSRSMASRPIARKLEQHMGQPDLRAYSVGTIQIGLKRIGTLSGGKSQQVQNSGINFSNAEQPQPAMPESFKTIRHIIAAEFLSETFKIATNFLQVTSFALAINSNWTKIVRKLLGVQDVLAGFSGGSSLLSIECAMPSDPLPPTISSALVIISTPFALMVFVQLLFLCLWLFLRRKGKKGKNQHTQEFSVFRSHAILTAITAIFFAYGNVTEELMKMVNCVKLDEETVDDLGLPESYSNYSTAKDSFWVEDTSQKCFEGDHRYLAYIIGVPGIVLFTLGVPILLFVFLMAKKDKLYDPDYLKTYGFVYEVYAEDHVYWEVITLARKGLVAAIVVFGYTLGPNLQAVLSLGVLIFALILQVVANPYKYDRLNELEGASLVVTMVTLYSSLVFQDDNTSNAGRVAMSVVVTIFNVAFVLILCLEIYMNTDRYADAKITHYGGSEAQGKLLPIKLMLVAWHFVKQKVTAPVDPSDEGFVLSIRKRIAKVMKWKMQSSDPLRPNLPAEHVDGVLVGHPETIEEHRSQEMEVAASLGLGMGASKEGLDYKERERGLGDDEAPLESVDVVDLSPVKSSSDRSLPSTNGGGGELKLVRKPTFQG